MPLLGALLFAGIAYAAYLVLSVQQSADAPGHCCGETVSEGCQVRYGYNDLLTLAQNAGFGADAGTAAAIAIAESNNPATNPPTANSEAYNPEPQDVPGKYCRDNSDDGLGSYGLMQIYRAAHPEFACVDLTNPQQNMQAAFKLYSESGGFRPWSTFKSGAYQEFLQ